MHSLLSKYLFYYPVTFLSGERIAKYTRQYRAFQWKDRSAIDLYHKEALQKLVRFAYGNSSFHRDRMRAVGIAENEPAASIELGRLPIMTKDDVVTAFDKLVTARARWGSRKTTGGSTGQAVTILKNRDALARERAATWRCYNWAGIGVGDPQARFWGVPLRQMNRFRYKAIDFISNRIRLSAFELNDEQMESYFRSILRFKPKYLYGYVSAILEFARFLNDREYRLPSDTKSVITTSEVLSDQIRAEIERATDRQVFNEYGCGEMGSIAHECERHSMHIVEDNVLLEILNDKGDQVDAGEIVVTDLHNFAMPLIRYRIGDFAERTSKVCDCGRQLAVIHKIHGRAYDMVLTRDGTRHHAEVILYIFEELKDRQADIKQFQVTQLDLLTLEITIVPGTRYRNASEQFISKALKERLHPSVCARYRYADKISREPSGKLRLVKSLLSTQSISYQDNRQPQ